MRVLVVSAPRRRGRPSLSDTGEQSVPVGTKLPASEADELYRLMRARRMQVSDWLRSLVRAELKREATRSTSAAPDHTTAPRRHNGGAWGR